jgi:hypothetical protein
MKIRTRAVPKAIESAKEKQCYLAEITLDGRYAKPNTGVIRMCGPVSDKLAKLIQEVIHQWAADAAEATKS